jgi:hypothetical protein
MKRPVFFDYLVLCLAAGLMVSCAKQPSGWGVSPCDLKEGQVGQVVSVSGIVAFVDDTVPGIYYADLEAGGCRVGITSNTAEMQHWNDEQQAAFEVGADITATGMLVSAPLPDRPEEDQLVIELRIPPEVHHEGDPMAGEQHQPPGELCQVTGRVGETITASGEITFVDGSEAAGVYAEMKSESGCFYKLWVERRFWEQWKASAQAEFSTGTVLDVEGIMTIVLGEQTIDISEPPIPSEP